MTTDESSAHPSPVKGKEGQVEKRDDGTGKKKPRRKKGKMSTEEFIDEYSDFLQSARGNFARKSTVSNYV